MNSIEVHYTLPNDQLIHVVHFYGLLRHLRLYIWSKTQGKQAQVIRKVKFFTPK